MAAAGGAAHLRDRSEGIARRGIKKEFSSQVTDRDVFAHSSLEFDALRAQELDGSVDDYIEQPLLLRYELDGKLRFAKPDIHAPGAGIVSTLAPNSAYASMCPSCVVDGQMVSARTWHDNTELLKQFLRLLKAAERPVGCSDDA